MNRQVFRNCYYFSMGLTGTCNLVSAFKSFYLLFNLSFSIPKMAVVAVLATIGFTSVGTLFSALAVHTKAREIMLPILFLPVVSPVIIAAVKASGLVIQGGTWSDLLPWLPVMIAFDIIFLIVSSLVFEFVLEE